MVSKGLIKVQSFRKRQNKRAYADRRIPCGILEKNAVTRRFLKRRMTDRQNLQTEIAALWLDVSGERDRDNGVVKNWATLFRVTIGCFIGNPSKIHIVRVTRKRAVLTHV